MDTYNRLMNIGEVIEYLTDKTDRYLNTDKIIRFLEEKKIPIVFQYQGWGTYEYKYESGYQSLNIEVDGYFSFQNTSDAMSIFKGFLTEIVIHEAIIYHLNSYRIRGNAPDGIEPRKGDDILFKTGGRSPMFIHPNIQSFIKIDSNKAGVLRVDLEEYIDNETMTAANTRIADLENQLAQAKAELANKPADEIELNPKTQRAVTCLLNVLFYKAEMDITAHKGTTNQNIVNSSKSLNAKITEKPVSYWIKQVQQLRIDIQKQDN